MHGLLYQVLDILAQGGTVKGSVELPDYLVLWELRHEKGSLKLRVTDHVDLGKQIRLTDRGRRGS